MRHLFVAGLALALVACHATPDAPLPLTLQGMTDEDQLAATLAVHLDVAEQRRLLALPGTWDTATVTLDHPTKLLQPLTRTLAKNVDLVPNGAGGYTTAIPFGKLRPSAGYTLTVQLWTGGAFAKLVAEKQQPVTLVGGVNNVAVTMALVPNLALTSAAPPAALPGTSVTLTGQGFSILRSLDKLTLGGTPVSTDTAAATALTTTVPDVGPTTVPYQVTVGTSVATLAGFQVLATIGTTLSWVSLPSHQTDPSIAYGNGQFLVSWTDDRVSGNTDIYAQRIDVNGVAVGPNFPVNASSGKENRSALAYNPETDQFYCVWQDSTNGNDVKGQLVNADGTLAGANTTITSSSTGAQTKPQVCYDATNHQFVVVYTDHRNGNNDIYGSRLDNTGKPIGADFPVIKTLLQQDNPAIAYGALGNTYLVAWNDDTNIYGQLVNRKGQNVGAPIAISPQTGKKQIQPGVAYNSQTGGFLVAWVDTASVDTIRAQLLDANGALVGPSIVVSSVPGEKASPRVAYEPWWDRYVVIWNDNRSVTHWDIYGQYLDANGASWGGDFAVKVTAGNQTYAELAVDPVNKRALVSYQDSSNGGNVYGQLIR